MRLRIALLLISLTAPLTGLSQAPSAPASSLVDSGDVYWVESIEAKYQELLSVYMKYLFPNRGFFVSASVVPAPGSQTESLPALPDLTFNRLGVRSLRQASRTVEVKISFAEPMKEDDLQKVRSLVEARFQLSSDSGDSVTVESMGVASNAQEMLERSKQDLDSTRSEIKSLSDQLATKESQLFSIQERAEQLKNKNSDLLSQIQDLRSKMVGLANESSLIPDSIKAYADIALVSIAIVILVAILGVVQGFRGMSKSVGSISTSIEYLGDAVSNSSGMGAGTMAVEASVESAAKNLGGSSGGEGLTVDGATLNAEVNKYTPERAQELKEELLPKLEALSQGFLFTQITDYLEAPGEEILAAGALDLIGPKLGQPVFARLTSHQKNQIQYLFRDREYQHEKSKYHIIAAEDLLTRILSDQLSDGKGAETTEISRQLAKVSNSMFPILISGMADQAVSRMFFHISPDRTASILTMMRGRDKDAYEKALAALQRFNNVQDDPSLDEMIKDGLERLRAATLGDQSPHVLKYFQKVIEASGEILEDEICDQLSQTEAVKNYLSRETVTFGSLFRLPIETMADLVQDLAPREIAAVYLQFPTHYQQRLIESLTSRVRDLVEEEVDFFSGKRESEVKPYVKSARMKVMPTLKRMKASGELDALLEQDGIDQERPYQSFEDVA